MLDSASVGGNNGEGLSIVYREQINTILELVGKIAEIEKALEEGDSSALISLACDILKVRGKKAEKDLHNSELSIIRAILEHELEGLYLSKKSWLSLIPLNSPLMREIIRLSVIFPEV